MLMKEIGYDTYRKIYYVLGLKNQYCQNDCTTQGNPQVQCNSYQLSVAFFREQQKFLKFLWRHKRP